MAPNKAIHTDLGRLLKGRLSGTVAMNRHSFNMPQSKISGTNRQPDETCAQYGNAPAPFHSLLFF